MGAELTVLFADTDLKFDGDAAFCQQFLQSQSAAQTGHWVQVVITRAVNSNHQPADQVPGLFRRGGWKGSQTSGKGLQI